MKLYTVRTACEVVGRWRVPGEPFPLTDKQAVLLAPPHGSVVALYAPPMENNDGRQHGHKRKNRRSA